MRNSRAKPARAPAAKHLLRVGDTAISYELRRSSRAKRLRIVVKPGRVEVVAPRFAGKRRIAAFVEAKRDWIYAKTRALRESELNAIPDRFVSGAKVLFHGRHLELTVGPGAVRKAEARLDAGFHVQVPEGLDEENRESAARAAVTQWLKTRAAEDARSLFERYCPLLGVSPAGLSIRGQTTIWGSCSAKGRLSLNWRLLAAPEPIFEYVVVHELCHLVEANHSRRFWALVERLLPDYRERRRWLKTHGVALG